MLWTHAHSWISPLDPASLKRMQHEQTINHSHPLGPLRFFEGAHLKFFFHIQTLKLSALFFPFHWTTSAWSTLSNLSLNYRKFQHQVGWYENWLLWLGRGRQEKKKGERLRPILPRLSPPIVQWGKLMLKSPGWNTWKMVNRGRPKKQTLKPVWFQGDKAEEEDRGGEGQRKWPTFLRFEAPFGISSLATYPSISWV